MVILRGYVLLNNLLRLLQRFGDDQVVVPKAGSYYGCPFITDRGVIQG